MLQFQKKLKLLKIHLKVWNKTTFGNIFTELKDLEVKTKTLQQNIIQLGRTDETTHQEKHLTNQLEERRNQEEALWRQKFRINWLKEGERNTKFFHRSTIQHRMHNRITVIKNQMGERLEMQEAIMKELRNHFRDIL